VRRQLDQLHSVPVVVLWSGQGAVTVIRRVLKLQDPTVPNESLSVEAEHSKSLCTRPIPLSPPPQPKNKSLRTQSVSIIRCKEEIHPTRLGPLEHWSSTWATWRHLKGMQNWIYIYIYMYVCVCVCVCYFVINNE
jgi:hypothetical protein